MPLLSGSVGNTVQGGGEQERGCLPKYSQVACKVLSREAGSSKDAQEEE